MLVNPYKYLKITIACLSAIEFFKKRDVNNPLGILKLITPNQLIITLKDDNVLMLSLSDARQSEIKKNYQ